MNARILICVYTFALLTAATSASAQRGIDDDPSIGGMVWDRLGDAGEAYLQLIADKAEYSAAIERARQDYWAVYARGEADGGPDGEFARLLWWKDYYYAQMKFSQKLSDQLMGEEDQTEKLFGMGRIELIDQLSIPLDGGISEVAEFEFDAWVEKVYKGIADPRTLLDISKLPVALKEAEAEYAAYKRKRDMAEYFRGPASPLLSSDPRTYYQGMRLRASMYRGNQKLPTMAETGARYDAMVQNFGEETVRAAVEAVRKHPRGKDGFITAEGTNPVPLVDDLIKKHVREAGDDEAFAIMLLDGFQKGRKPLDELIAHYGRDKVLEAVRTVRAEKSGNDRQRLEELLPSDVLYKGPLEVLEHLERSAGAMALLEDADGSLLMFRLNHIVRLAPRTGERSVVYGDPDAPVGMHQDEQGNFIVPTGPLVWPYSVAVQDEWILVCVGASRDMDAPDSNGAVYRLRTNGEQLATLLQYSLKEPTKGGAPKLLLAEPGGNVLVRVDGPGPWEALLRIMPANGSVETLAKYEWGRESFGYGGFRAAAADLDGNTYVLASSQPVDLNDRRPRRNVILKFTPSGEASEFLSLEGRDLPSFTVGRDGQIYGVQTTNIICIPADGAAHRVLAQLPEDAAGCLTALVHAEDGRLYGMANRAGNPSQRQFLFRLNTDGSEFQVLHEFNETPVLGMNPTTFLIGSDGTLYGVTGTGGRHGKGTLFRLNLDGPFPTLPQQQSPSAAAEPQGQAEAPTAAGTEAAAEPERSGRTAPRGTGRRERELSEASSRPNRPNSNQDRGGAVEDPAAASGSGAGGTEAAGGGVVTEVFAGRWAGAGHVYEFELRLEIKGAAVEGEIHWKLASAPQGSHVRSRVGAKATEYVQGTYDAAQRRLALAGTRVSDQTLIAKDRYALTIAPDGKSISGTSGSGQIEGVLQEARKD